MSKVLTETLLQVLHEQASRLGHALKKNYSEQQSQFLAKQCVAAVYGFDHWASMSFFIKRNEDPFHDPVFEHVFLHPKTISDNSPEFINQWEERKERIGRILNIKPSKVDKDSFQEFYRGDELANYLAKMHGFSSMSEIWMNLKYHLEKDGKYYSFFDTKKTELLIKLKNKPQNSDFLQELLVNQSAFGQTLIVGPKEWFKYELDCSSVAPADFHRHKSPFYGWTIGRLINLFKEDINNRMGKFITAGLAINLLESILPILVYDFVKNDLDIDINAFCEILKLKNIMLVIGDSNYPKPLQLLIKDYLNNIGHDVDKGFSDIDKGVQSKHDHAAMLISSAIFNMSNFFNADYFCLSDDFILMDVDSYGYMENYELKQNQVNLANEVIEELSKLKDNSMLIIYDSEEEPASEYQIESIRSYCEMKGYLFVIITVSEDNKYNINNSVVIESDGFISGDIQVS